MKVLWAALPLAICASLHAEAPSLDALFPAGATAGTTNNVTAVGKFASWPVKAWISGEGVAVGIETNKGKLSITVSRDAAPGPRLLRLYNEEGASEPRAFVIGPGREVIETEPNNAFSKPQALSDLPVTVNGRLDKNGDVDSFAVHLPAGHWLEARVDCYTLLSKVDAVLRLVSTNGQQLAWNHDFITLDPRLIWHATNDETVVLQIFGFAYPPGSEVALTGGEGAVYRLHVSASNAAPRICPAAGEHEPNDTATNAEPVELPALAAGAIQTAADVDRYRFKAGKDEFIELRVDAASLGSPLDAWLRIEDSVGNQVARSDDAEGSADPHLEWKAPSNGVYIAAVGSVTHRGSADHCYRLSMRSLDPGYDAVLGANSLVLIQGATNELKVELKRLRGFTNGLSAAVEGLPGSVTLLPVPIATTNASVALQFFAATNAPVFQGPIRVFLTDTNTSVRRAVPFDLTTKGETGFTHLLVETNDQVWLTVRAKPVDKPKTDAAKAK